MNSAGLKAACEAAARVNAMLMAKGKLKQAEPPPKPLLPITSTNSLGMGFKLNDALFTSKVEINDIPVSARNQLTKGSVQDEICRNSEATISTKGRYIPPGEKNLIDRPLYLYIQGASQAAVNKVVEQIYAIILKHGGTIPNNHTLLTQTSSSQPHYYQDKVFVGIDHISPAFNIREKILGPNESFLNHIRTETNSTVTLRGKGSGHIEPSGQEAFEALHIHIMNQKPEGLRAAKLLATNLIETIQSEYAQWLHSHPISLPASIIPQQNAVTYPVVTTLVTPQTPLSLPAQVAPPITAALPSQHPSLLIQPAPPVYPPGTQAITVAPSQGLVLPSPSGVVTSPPHQIGPPPPTGIPFSFATTISAAGLPQTTLGTIPSAITYPILHQVTPSLTTPFLVAPPPPPPPGTTPIEPLPPLALIPKRKAEDSLESPAKRLSHPTPPPVPQPVPSPSSKDQPSPKFTQTLPTAVSSSSTPSWETPNSKDPGLQSAASPEPPSPSPSSSLDVKLMPPPSSSSTSLISPTNEKTGKCTTTTLGKRAIPKAPSLKGSTSHKESDTKDQPKITPALQVLLNYGSDEEEEEED